MTTYWSYDEPLYDDAGRLIGNGRVALTRDEAIATYWPFDVSVMQALGRADQITPQRCFEDWCIMHWAEPVEEDGTHV